MALLREFGDVRMRNAGRDNAYPNVKPAGAEKGVNLKEFVFSPAFVELPTAEKLSALAADAADQYEAIGHARATPDDIRDTLDAWLATHARELKYLNSGSRTYRIYQESSPSDRQLMLAELERGFYGQHLKAHHERAPEQPADLEQRLGQLRRVFEYGDADYRGTAGPAHAGRGSRSTTGFRPEPGGRTGVGRDPFDAVHRQFDFVATTPRAAPPPVHDLRNLSGRTVERLADRPAVLVPHHAYDELEPAGTLPAYRLRRSRDCDGEFAAQRVTGRVADNAVSQLARDVRQHQTIRRQDAEFAQIRRTLDAHRLLAELSHTHGVRPAKYEVVTGRDGGDRIRAGKRHLNVSDFLTKELNLPWQEAAPLLQAVYARQLRGEPVPTPKELPRAALWRAYSVDRDAHVTARRDAWAAQRASEQQRAGEIREAFAAARTAIRSNSAGEPAARRAAISVARMTRIEQEAALRHAIARERDALRARYGRVAGPSFADWLRTRAEQGDEQALAELRRTARPVRDGDTADHGEPINEIRAHASGRDAEPNAILYRAPALSWSVDPRGQVTYRRDGVDVVRDRGANVQVLQPDHAALETGLRLAQAKFGRTLELAGHDAFQLEAVKVAVALGLDIQFSDARLNEAMHALRKQRVDALARDVLGPASTPNKDVTNLAPDQAALSPDPKPGI
ncbi:LPD7 domain-containing protein [Burkholderia cepacia]|uniref:LPD7 domain-containing protein n=1 Tax=Burkholderia cepacia TaxID=292 RepID=UPI001FC84FFA|nr:LPD7 domain-containing protein [Burkholderia cepacia]